MSVLHLCLSIKGEKAMQDWKLIGNANQIDWLLEKHNPSVRYFTLKYILDKPDDDGAVLHAKDQIMQIGVVPKILQKQSDLEYINSFSKFYTNKYRGIVWSLITLAELGAKMTPQIKEQCEYLLENSQEREDGGFSQSTAIRTGGGRITEVIPCLTGNLVFCLIHFGYLEDPRLQRAIQWLTKFMRFNDGVEDEPQSEKYNQVTMCWGKHTCHMAVVKALKGLSAIPVKRRTKEVNDTIQKAVEFILVHHIFKRSHDLNKKSKPGWLRFGFPLMYQTDILEILDILTKLGIKDKRMQDAIEIVIKKQDENGKWKAENTYCSDRLLLPIEEKKGHSKWITLRAMTVLKRYYHN